MTYASRSAAGARVLVQVAWDQPQGLQRGGDGCELLLPPCSWGTSGIPGHRCGCHAPSGSPAVGVRPGAGEKRMQMVVLQNEL